MWPEPNVVRRGAGIPLLAVHGNGVDHRLLLPLDEALADSGAWERIYLDLPGFGGTPALAGRGGLPELADWLVATARDLVDERPFAVIANSLGGLLARQLQARLPDEVLGLALIAPVVQPDPARRHRPQPSVTERDEDLLASLPPADRDDFTAIATRQDQASWERFRTHALPGIRAADRDAMERLAARYHLESEHASQSLPCEAPTLIVTGRQDHIVGWADQVVLLDHFPRATYVVVDGAGHNVHLEQPALVEAALRDWAQRVAQAANVGPRHG